MAIRVAIFALPMAVIAGLVLLLNGLDAGVGIAVTTFGLVVVVSGAALGFLADRLPEFPSHRRAHRLAGLHHGER